MREKDGGFVVGVNLPWLQYGCDFGANAWQADGGVAQPERRRRLTEVFARLADRGLTAVRWFMLCDGRAGVRFAGDGTAVGLDDCFWRDLEVGVEEAGRHGLSVVFVLFDFTWWKRRRWVEGVACGGHRRATTSAARREALLEGVVTPILERCRREPAISAWDVVNEPEWVTLGVSGWNPCTSVSRRSMRAFIERCAARVHAETNHLATVGLASTRGLILVEGLGLDVYQVHWYDRRERRAPLDAPIAATLDRPLWLGEFPTAGSARTVPEILETAQSAGYACALGWSAEAGDQWSDGDRMRGAGGRIRDSENWGQGPLDGAEK
ncbi:MAG TPA: hypothetical protein VGK32_03055 [Vicinamibacterales bacterium]|jgi:hypothetical protein